MRRPFTERKLGWSVPKGDSKSDFLLGDTDYLHSILISI